MDKNLLSELSVFAEVAKAKGFRAAGENLNLGAASVSETIQRFEDRLGMRLIERTTRKMSLTDAGEKLFLRTLPVLADLENALAEFSADQDDISGTLRLSAPRSSSPFFLDELIANFALANSKVDVEVIYDDRKVDLVTAGVDAAIRSESLLEKESHSVKIGPKLNMVLVAAPDYLARNGTPSQPTDLVGHDGIRFCFSVADKLAPWNFIAKNKKTYAVSPNPRLIVNDLVSMTLYARAGLGLAYLYKKPAEPYIESGELVTLFDRCIPDIPRYTINYLTKRHMPARLRAFIDFAKQAQQQ